MAELRTSALHTVLTVLLLTFAVGLCFGDMDCSIADFGGATTDSHRVYCGSGYHECGLYGDGCCSDVSAFPVELTLVILGPVAALVSCLLTVFVLKLVISGALDKGPDTIQHIDVGHIIQ